MNANVEMEIKETPEYGTELRCYDVNIADEFDDFLTEHCFVFFSIKLDNGTVSFLFGQASAPSKVRDLYERFKSNRN